MQDLIAELDTDGYTIVRGFLSPQEAAEISEETHRLYQEGLKHRTTYRHKNLLFEVLDDPEAGRRVVLQAHWTAWISPLMERMRRSERYFAVLEPFLGPDIKQISHRHHRTRHRSPNGRERRLTGHAGKPSLGLSGALG